MPVLGSRMFSALMIAALAVPAAAQQPKACELDEGQPNQVARAKLDIQLAQSAGKPEDAAAKLKDATKLLYEGDLKKNPTGRAFVLGQTLVFWMAQPGITNGMSTRGGVGLLTDPTAPFDLIATMDSAFTVVETANPECTANTASWRQQKGWVDLDNHALELSGADKTDSAVIVAKRSLQLSRSAPYGYMVLAQSAQKQNQPKVAIENYKLAIEVASRDTSQAMADNRRSFQLNLGNYAADLAEQAKGAEKTAYLAEASAAFAALGKDPGTKFADAARNATARIATMSGDTTAIRNSYSDQLANPGAFSYNSLMLAAVTAARAGQNKDAIKLFEAAHAVNPSHRDVLYNLSRLYLLDSSYAKGLPYTRQLIAVDPSNPDNYSLIAIAYASIKRGYDIQNKKLDSASKLYGQRANAPRATAAVVKANIDSAAKLNPLMKAYGDSARIAVDSAIKYNDIMTKLPARVAFTEFTAGDAKTTIGGSIANLTDASKTFSLKIEFVDKSGNVVSTQDVSVGPVAPHTTTNFQTTGTGSGIVAFRYAPIS